MMTAPLQRHVLRQRELRVAGAGRHIDHENVEGAPGDVAQHLGDRRHHHRPAPDHRGLFLDQKTDRHDGEAEALDRNHLPVVVQLRFLVNAGQPRHRRPVDVGIEQTDPQTEIAQAQRQIERRGRFTDTALAGGHRDDGGNAGNLRLLRHRRGRTLRRAMRRDGLHAVRMAMRGRRRRCRRAGFAFGGQRDHGGGDAGNGAYRGLGRGPDAFPGAGLRGIDIDREEHLAVADGDRRQHIGVGQGDAAWRLHLGQHIENLLLRYAHGASP